ncbi:MAG: hypothetical protein R6U46_06510 [Marinilabilia sp.]
MKDQGTKNIIAAIIIGVSLIVAASIYALATRYEMHPEMPFVIDRWTGKQVKQ